MAFIQTVAHFLLGGFGYVGLELLWRGRSHFSMFLAGGVCFLLLGSLNRVKPRLPMALRCLVGALVITAVELATGLIFNRQYQVWDYRQTPCNFMGQICLPFTLLWIPVSFGALLLHKFVSKKSAR